jgi:hypothetical protein
LTAPEKGVGFLLYLDDLRPWRVSVEPSGTSTQGGISQPGTTWIYVDVGGRPSQVNQNIAVYAPEPGAPVGRSFEIAGAARVFEANVNWRVRDSGGREVATGHQLASIGTGPVWGTFLAHVDLPSSLTGKITLEVFWASPKDGSDQDLVQIPLQLP